MKRIVKSLLLVVLVAILSALVLKPYLHAGFPYTHDGENHLARFANYKIAIKEGQIPPRFAPNLMNHYGYPVFNFNYPLANIASLPCSFLKCNYELSFKLIMAVAVVMGLWGLVRWLEALGFDFRTRMFGVGVFAATPYLFSTIAYRGNIGEVMALSLLPWLVLSVEEIRNSLDKNWPKRQLVWWLALWTAFLLSHNVAVLFGLPILLLYALVRLPLNQIFWKRFLFLLIGSIGFSLWFWLPAVVEKSLVIVGDGGLSQDFIGHFPTLRQLLFSPLVFGFSQVGSVDSLSFNLGLLQWTGLSLATILLVATIKQYRQRLFWILLSMMCLLLVFFQLKQSAWLWQSLPLVRYIQFPWRLTIFFSWLVVPLLCWLYSQGSKLLKSLMIIVLIIQLALLVKITPVDYFHRTNQDYDAFSQSTTTQHENLPKTFSYAFFSQQWQPTAEILSGNAELKIHRWSGSSREYLVKVNTPAIIVEPTMDFVGWETVVSPQPGKSYVAERYNSPEIAGRVAYQIPIVSFEIRTSFTQNTWSRMVGNGISVLTLILLLLWLTGMFTQGRPLGFMAVFSWRVGLFVIAWMAPLFLMYQPSFPYADTLLQSTGLPSWIYSWANFDGVHYLTIIDHGYVGTGLIQAFFPLYPLLISTLQLPRFNPILIGLAISFISTVLLIYTWQKLMQLDYHRAFSRLASLVLLLFPTSLFLAGLYTESLFLLLVISSFWFARTKRWWLAGLMAAGASATRVTGIILIPALVIELAEQTQLWEQLRRNASFRTVAHWIVIQKSKLLAISIGLLGLLAYMLFLVKAFGDPLYFFHVQEEFGVGRQTNLVLYPQVIWRYIKILVTSPIDLKYFTYVQELAAGVAGLGVIIWSFWKTRWSYAVFSLLAFLLPTFTGTFTSMPRYLVVCFVVYIVIANWINHRPFRQIAWFLLSTALLIFNTILFIQGYWVA